MKGKYAPEYQRQAGQYSDESERRVRYRQDLFHHRDPENQWCQRGGAIMYNWNISLIRALQFLFLPPREPAVSLSQWGKTPKTIQIAPCPFLLPSIPNFNCASVAPSLFLQINETALPCTWRNSNGICTVQIPVFTQYQPSSDTPFYMQDYVFCMFICRLLSFLWFCHQSSSPQ